MRGRNTLVVCTSCGRSVPRDKAVFDEKPISLSTAMQTTNDVRFFERRKVCYCISCAKHKGIFERKKRRAEERAKRF